MKLWSKGKKLDKMIEDFTTGKDRELDLLLAEYDVIASVAHVIMLESVGLLSAEESRDLVKALKKIYDQITTGNFSISKTAEDIHSEVETQLTELLGDTGKKVHTGRSRNDQVLTDLHLFIRDKIREIVKEIQKLTGNILHLSERYKDYMIPGYTHFQAAMPSSFGLWFGSFAETLSDDLLILHAAYRIINQNPLGSGAGFGTSLPINRQLTTDLLGFDNLRYNSMHAMNARGKSELITVQALSAIASTVGKYAGDVCLFMSGNFNFIDLPGKFLTGSSIMPHKRNPDIFELVRATCSSIQALPGEISLISNNLPSGYHRDYQVMKEHFLPVFEKLTGCLRIMDYVFPELIIKKVDLTDEKYRYIFSVEKVNRLVMDGIPFREAYRKVADDIQQRKYSSSGHVDYTHEGSIGNLCNDKISEKINQRIQMFEFEKWEKAIEELLGMSD